ncbi:MAG: hypothetical protein HYT70_00190 [Candidatus Aenigmarchaeota archaeon]|nr:hypothetical protein [Candidatus Aenigmarchaeota archaeon]
MVYKEVTTEEVSRLPLGRRVEGIFEIYIGFVVNGQAKLCIGDTEIILPDHLYRWYIRTPELLEKIADYLSVKNIRTRVRGIIVEGHPREVYDDDGEHVQRPHSILAEMFEPEGGLIKAIADAKRYEMPEL